MNHLIERCDEAAEHLMRAGQWNEARELYIDCRSLEASELTLRVSTLEWRRDCALYINKTLDEPIPIDDFVQDITSRYDSFVAEWMVRNYHGVKLVRDGDTYNVIRRDGQ